LTQVDVVDRILDGLLRSFALSEMVMADMLMFNEAKPTPGMRIVDIIAEFEHALLAYKSHIHPATLAFMFVAKLPSEFRAELFARPAVTAPPADGDAAACEKTFRGLLEAARSVASSVKFATVPGSRTGAAPRHDPMVLGAVEDQEEDPSFAVAAVAATPSLQAYWRSKRVCMRCGMPPDDDPPASVCERHWKGTGAGARKQPASGKAKQC
jgi:hypothetical protein